MAASHDLPPIWVEDVAVPRRRAPPRLRLVVPAAQVEASTLEGSDGPFIAGLVLLFAVASSALPLALLERPTHDTLTELLSLRIWASDLLHAGDWPLWYPYARYGFPNTSLYLISSVFNPAGLLLGALFRYDTWTLQLEFAIWRAVGFAGAYWFARRHTASPIGAAACAACYMGSGVVETTAWMRTIFPGLALAPWIFAGVDRIVAARTRRAWLRGVGITAIAYAGLVWAGYPGTWLTLPIMAVPFVLVLTSGSAGSGGLAGWARALARSVGGFTLAGALVVGMAAFPLAQTIAFPLFGSNLRNAASPFEGVLAPQDVLALWLVNPDYLPGLNGVTYQTLYFGVIPLLAVCASFPLGASARRRWVRPALLTAAGIVTVVGINVDPGPEATAAMPWIAWATALFAVAAFRRPLARWERFDVALVVTAVCGLLLATSNPLSDALRYYVFPFSIVRWNWVYAWIAALLLPLTGWRAIEGWVRSSWPASSRPPGRGRAPAYAFGHRGSAVGLLAVVVMLANLRLIVGPEDAFTHVRLGAIFLPWLAALVGLSLVLVGGHARWRRTRGQFTAVLWGGAIALGVAAAVVGWFLFGRDAVVRTSVPLPPGSRQVFDLLQPVGVLAALAHVLRTAGSQRAALRGAAAIMVLDICLAMARYGSDGGIRVLDQGPATAAPVRAFSFAGAQRLEDEDYSAPQHTVLELGQSKRPTMWVWSDGVPQMAALDRALGTPSIFRDFAVFPAAWRPGGSPWQIVVAPDEFRGPDELTSNLTKTSVALAGTLGPRCADPALPGAAPLAAVTHLLSSRVTLSVHADCERLMVLTDTWAPGWQVRVDGAPRQVLNVDGVLRGVMVPEGAHTVEWTYRPPYALPLLVVTAGAVALSLALIAAGGRGCSAHDAASRILGAV